MLFYFHRIITTNLVNVLFIDTVATTINKNTIQQALLNQNFLKNTPMMVSFIIYKKMIFLGLWLVCCCSILYAIFIDSEVAIILIRWELMHLSLVDHSSSSRHHYHSSSKSSHSKGSSSSSSSSRQSRYH